MNIPSERLHDAGDDGGWLGGWHRPKRLGVPDPTAPLAGFVDQTPPPHHPLNPDAHVFPGGPSFSGAPSGASLAEQCLGDETPVYDPAAEAQRAADEVPWPKFHPVPIRPVFGANR